MRVKNMIAIAGFLIFFVAAVMLFEPGEGPTGFFVSTTSLAIKDYKNSAELNNNLNIDFTTKGTNDLTITASKGDMQFIELRCNNQLLNPSVQGSKIEYKNYNCDQNSLLIVKVLSKELNIDFRYSNELQQVTNIAP